MSEFIKNRSRELGWRIQSTIERLQLESLYRSDKELSDYELLYRVDPYLTHALGRKRFDALQEKMAGAEEVYDLGSGRDILRGTIFLNTARTVGVDPAYRWYEYRSSHSFSIGEPYPYHVFGGRHAQEQMIGLLKQGFKRLSLPRTIEGEEPMYLLGTRKGRRRVFTLLPVDAAQWLQDQPDQSLPNIVMWRVFPNFELWSKAISSLATGGFLITTGIGKPPPEAGREAVVCGIDIDNSPIPLNGNTDAVGLKPLTDLSEIYFYQKVRHYPAKALESRLVSNSQ